MVVQEDNVDAESLQAQIDISMSFAHDLVTSWIKPAHFTQLRSGDVAQILEEELRRPPRLGVGASIPAILPLAHEASKLKRKLGRPEARHGGLVGPQQQDSSKSDDEEYKGRSTKRKTKMDPFGHEGNKKKRKAEPTTNPSAENVSRRSNSASGEFSKHDPFSRQGKQQMGPDDQSCHATEGQRSSTLVSSPPLESPVQNRFSLSLNTPTSPLGPFRETSAPVPGKLTTPESTRSRVYYTPVPGKAKPIGIPLLNLDGPPELADDPGNTSELNRFRKKRKRRKKKRKQTTTGTGENSDRLLHRDLKSSC